MVIAAYGELLYGGETVNQATDTGSVSAAFTLTLAVGTRAPVSAAGSLSLSVSGAAARGRGIAAGVLSINAVTSGAQGSPGVLAAFVLAGSSGSRVSLGQAAGALSLGIAVLLRARAGAATGDLTLSMAPDAQARNVAHGSVAFVAVPVYVGSSLSATGLLRLAMLSQAMTQVIADPIRLTLLAGARPAVPGAAIGVLWIGSLVPVTPGGFSGFVPLSVYPDEAGVAFVPVSLPGILLGPLVTPPTSEMRPVMRS